MKTTLINLRTYRGPLGDVVYIDRRNRLLGNPYRVGAWSDRLGRRMTREDSLALFRERFAWHVEHDPGYRAAVLALAGRTVACWCAPLACHGDVYVEWLRKNS